MTKVLVIRFSSIGDIVLTTPVVRNLKEQMYGGVEIHYLTKSAYRSIVEPNPHVERVHTIEKSTREVIDELKALDFDYIIDLHRNIRTAQVKRKLKILDFSFDKLNWKKWLWVNLGINKMPDIHIVDRYMETLKAFGIENDNRGLDFFWKEEEKDMKLAVPESHQNGFVAVSIGAAHWRKRPKQEQYVKIIQALDYPVVLLGGPSEAELGEEIARECECLALNMAGKSSLGETAHWLKESNLVITPDTGVMHIAAALKKPIISLWAATVPEFGMYPYQNDALNKMVGATHLSKRPCSKLGTKCKYKPCKCIDEIPVQEAIDSALTQIKP